MNKERYARTVAFFKENKRARFWLAVIYKYLPNVVFISYAGLLAYTFFYMRDNFWEIMLFPLGVLIFTSVFRAIINEPRPYEYYGIESVFKKKTKGKSLPSRHTASTFIIAMAFYSVNPVLGIIMILISVLIGASRVLAGAHYIRDVLIAMAISLEIGWIMLVN